MPRARSTAALGALVALTLSACAAGSSAGGAAVSEGDPGACPGQVVDVVVSVGQWGDLVRSLGGARLEVVLNGAGYDHWAQDAVATVDPHPSVVSAATVSGAPEQGADPHLWYSPEAVQEMSTAVSRALADLAGADASEYLAQQAAAWAEDRAPYAEAIASASAVAAGHTFAATEPVFDRMAAAVGLTDATPPGYRRASSNDSEPAPGDLTAFESALSDGSIDVLVYNTQTSGTVPEQLRSAAERAGVPVVEVSESPTDPDGSFVSWQVGQLTELSKALSA